MDEIKPGSRITYKGKQFEITAFDPHGPGILIYAYPVKGESSRVVDDMHARTADRLMGRASG